MNQRKRLFLGLASVTAVVAIGGAALLSGVGVTQRSEILYMTDGPAFKDVPDMTRSSVAVAHVRIVSAGAPYLIPFDTAVTTVVPAPKDNGPKGKAGQPTSAIPTVQDAHNGILKTDFTVEVLDNVRGAGIKKGDRLIVSQLGGKTADGAAVANTEHDPLMQVGDEEVLFLSKDASSGKFFTTGGGAGRFKVQPNGSVQPVDHDSPAGLTHSGKPATSLKLAVQAVR
ncbi:MAG TPA: hypothetical protein VGM69_00305 [Chloroflexota bacterium]|jgi:hypothetical protein